MRYKTLLIIAGLILAMWSFVALGSALEGDRINLSEQTEEVSAEIINTDVVESDDRHSDYDIVSTYKYDYKGEEYTTEFSTSYREPATTVRVSNDEYDFKTFSERLETKADNMEGSEESLYISPDDPSDAERFSTDNFVSNLTWGLVVVIWIPVLVWFCRSFVNDIIN